MKHNPAHYEELINLEGLDRRLKDDIQRFAFNDDKASMELAQLARREAQNRMLQITLEERDNEMLDLSKSEKISWRCPY